MTSGFADEADTPVWMQPYIVSALSNGMISGVSSDSGVVFRPTADLTKAEAMVLLQNVLQLPASSTKAVFSLESEQAIPVWAADAAAALSASGIEIDAASSTEVLARRDAAKVLYTIHCLMEDEALATFYWAQ